MIVETPKSKVRFLGVTKTYGSIRAVDRVSLDIEGGEFVTLLGPSGSGKTTLLMILAGFVLPSVGDVLIGDRSILRLPPHRRNIGMVFQDYALFPHMTVFDNVAYPLKLRKISKADISKRVGDALQLIRLDGFEHRRIQELSGGQLQRVALARAIVFGPAIMLMDEPLSALDKKLREHMQIEIRRLHDTLGVTTIYVTHDQREALTISDRVAVINNGRVMQLDTPRTVYDCPANSFVADFIGESTFVSVDRNGSDLAVYDTPLCVSSPVPEGNGQLSLVLRPERLKILAADEQREQGVNYFEGILQDTVFQGESVLQYVKLRDGTEVMVRDLSMGGGTRSQREPGDSVTVALHRDDTLVVLDTES